MRWSMTKAASPLKFHLSCAITLLHMWPKMTHNHPHTLASREQKRGKEAMWPPLKVII